MTKKTFVAVAKGFAAQLKALESNQVLPQASCRWQIQQCAEMFCTIAECENSRFDRARFLAACGF